MTTSITIVHSRTNPDGTTTPTVILLDGARIVVEHFTDTTEEHALAERIAGLLTGTTPPPAPRRSAVLDPTDPYLMTRDVRVVRRWNPAYPQEALCTCGHPYDRHFDSYEDMRPVGCKYCNCDTFVRG